jgi:hypothetical protein
MTRLTWLDGEFADGNVVLGVLLGTLGACSSIRAVLPDADDTDDTDSVVEAKSSVDPFVALLLGVVAVHERLTTLAGTGGAEPVGRDETNTLMRLVGLTR